MRNNIIWKFSVFSFLVSSFFKNLKSNHHLLFLAIFPDLEMLQFWFVNYKWQFCKLFYILDMSEILDNIYVWVFLVNSKSVLILSFVKYTLYSHCTQNCSFAILGGWKPLFCDKNLQNLLIFAYSFSPKNSTAASRKISMTQKLLVVESFPTPYSITFVMRYRLVYNMRSHFNQLNTVWNSYSKSLKPILETIKNKLNARMNLIDYVHVFTILLVSNDKNIIKLKNTQSST